MPKSVKHPLTEQLDRAEWALMEVLNDTDRPAAARGDLESLRGRLQEARKACIEAGLDGRTFLEQVAEAGLERHRRNEEHVRQYAEDQSVLPDRLTRRTRISIAFGMALLIGGVLVATSAAVSQMLLSLLGAALVFAAVNAMLIRWCPTGAIRVGKLAADLDVNILNFYKEDSAERLDYLRAMDIRRSEKARQGHYSMLRFR